METQSNHQDTATEHDYRFNNFDIRIIADDLRFSRDALRPGDKLPNETVVDTSGQISEIYDLCHEKPLLLMTGSITCPMTISSFPKLESLQEELGDKVNFALLYVREAHPAENYPQPETIDEKIKNAKDLQEIYSVKWPVVIDDINGSLHKSLDIMPNSAHLIGKGGEILFQSLWVSDTPAIEKALVEVKQGASISKNVSQRVVAPFVRGAGYMHNTFNLAGPSSYRELVFGAPPIALLARTASFFTFLPEKARGLGAIISLASIAVGGAYWAFTI